MRHQTIQIAWKSLEREYGAAALATGGSIQATIDTRRTLSNTLVSGLTGTTKTAPDIGYSLRWHDPDRFNGFDLSPLNAGTPAASWFAAKAVELSMEIPATSIGPRGPIDNNVVERAIRPLALNRNNPLFAGSDGGAGHWAVIASLVETCKLLGVEPHTAISPTSSPASSTVTLGPVSMT